jgi:HD-like signal output (HDOD) protein
MQSVPLDQIEAEAAERRIERVYALPSPPAAVRQLLAMQQDSLLGDQLHRLFDTRPNLRRQLTACQHLLRAVTDADEKQHKEARHVHRIGLAIAVARSFSYVCNGPLGAHAFWHHGLSNAVLCYKLAPRRLCKGMAFLTGLLHNIGFMVIAYLFPPEFKMLNRLFASHPEMSATVLERCVLGLGEAQELLSMGHAQTGYWLLQEWGMPTEPAIVAREHHNAGYRGVAEDYCGLVVAANRLLAAHAIGDTSADPLDGDVYPELVAVDPSLADVAKYLASGSESMAIAVRELIARPNIQHV